MKIIYKWIFVNESINFRYGSPLPNFYFFKIRLGGMFRPVIVNILLVETYEFEPSLTRLAKHLKEEKTN